MSRLMIYQDNHTDSTVISNRFIDEYMLAANDVQLKIYLYLIRMMSASRSTSISDIADLFNYTEKDIMRALKYWEKHRLLTLDYDEHRNVVGIHLMDFDTPAADAAAAVPLASVVPISSKLNAGTAIDAGRQADRTTPGQAASAGEDPKAGKDPDADADPETDERYVKPNYTLDEVKAFKTNEETSRLLFITEQYLRRILSVNEIQTIFFISDKLAFSEDLIDYLIQHCVGLGKRSLSYIEKVAIDWAKAGVTTPEEAALLPGKYDKPVYEILRALGRIENPTPAEVSFITRWRKEYGFTKDVILAACDRAALNTGKNRLHYVESILSSWRQAGVHSRKDIQALEENFQKTKAARPAAAVNNMFNQFAQNSYDFDALEKELISN